MTDDERKRLFDIIVECAEDVGDYPEDQYWSYISSFCFTEHTDLVKEINRLDAAITEKLTDGKQKIIEPGSIIDHRNDIVSYSGYLTAVNKIAEIAGIDKDNFRFMLDESRNGDFQIKFKNEVKKLFNL